MKRATFDTNCVVFHHKLVDEFSVEGDSKVVIQDNISKHSDIFHFSGRVLTTKDEFQMSAYSTIASPLVKRASMGDSTALVIGGNGSLDFTSYLLSTMSSRGILAQSANQLLNSIMVNGKREGTVTFSWYRITCSVNDSDEQMIDVLKSASDNSMDNVQDSELSLKELDRGRGVTIPGLWEVELSTSSDVDAVITHVQRISSHAQHESGTAHSIIQLSVTSDTGFRDPLSTLGASPEKKTGKITFVMLGNMQIQQEMGSFNASGSSNKLCSWVDAIRQMVASAQDVRTRNKSMTMNSPSIRSKLVLVLKDILRARQNASVLLMLQPSIENLSSVHQWLQLSEYIENIRRLYANELMQAGSNRTPSRSNPMSRIPGSASSATSSRSYGVAMKGNTMTPSRFTGANTPHSLLPPAPPTESHHSPLKHINDGSYLDETSSPDLYAHGDPYGVAENNTSHSFQPQVTRSLNKSKGSSTSPPKTEESYDDEMRSLRETISLRNEQLNQANAAYKTLAAQLHEDGSTLNNKDKERYRQVLAELKDYEIYKEVMESALTKLQAEVETLLSDNQTLKNKLTQSDNLKLKRSQFKEQYTQDLSSTRRELSETKKKLEESEALVKKINKEKEELRNINVSLKADRHKVSKQYDDKCSEYDKLKKKMALLGAKDSQRENDFKAAKEAEEKAVDEMLSYQEENELLKSAVCENHHSSRMTVIAFIITMSNLLFISFIFICRPFRSIYFYNS